MIDNGLFRSAMAHLGAAVNIITTDGPAGRYGITASAVCSVTDEPASLLVCVNSSSRMRDMIVENGVLAVNVLCGEHEPICESFATRGLSVDERFALGHWKAMANGVPALDGALVNFACRVDAVKDVGTHGIVICQVEEIAMRGQGDGLVYFDRTFHRLPLRAA